MVNLIGKVLTPEKKILFYRACKDYGILPILTEGFSIENSWFLGFVDGEGYFSIKNRNTLTMSISQKKVDILNAITNSFEIGYIYYDKS